MIARKSMLAVALLLATVAPSLATEWQVGNIVVENPWARATAPGAPVAGGYMTITNVGSEPDVLVGGSVPFAGRVEVHEMAMENGVMRMREVAGGLLIPPGETLTLQPGGLHVMFMALTEPLVEGKTLPATLRFERAGEITVDLSVAGIGARSHGHGD